MISRRDFLKTTGMTATALLVASPAIAEDVTPHMLEGQAYILAIIPNQSYQHVRDRYFENNGLGSITPVRLSFAMDERCIGDDYVALTFKKPDGDLPMGMQHHSHMLVDLENKKLLKSIYTREQWKTKIGWYDHYA